MLALKLSIERENKLVDMREIFHQFESPVTIKLYKDIKRRGDIFTHILKNTCPKGKPNIEAEVILQATGNKTLSHEIIGDVYVCTVSEQQLHTLKQH